MNRLSIFLIILSIYLTFVYGFELKEHFGEHSLDSGVQTNLLDVESRRRKKGHYFLYPFHHWYALTWIYWVKVKLIVVAFFVGTTFIWGVQYLNKYYQSCPDGGHIHYDHGHYRSFEDPQMPKFLQNLQQSRRKRFLRNANV